MEPDHYLNLTAMTERVDAPSGTAAADALGRLAAALNDSALLVDQLEQVAECAAEMTRCDHADITLFDPMLRRFIPPRSNRVFMHQGDEDAAAWIRDARSPLLVPDLNYSASDNDLTLYNRDIASYLGVPIARGGIVEGALMVFNRLPRGYDQGEPEALTMLASLASVALNQHRLQLDAEEASRILLRLAMTDPQTGVATRQQFEQLLRREWQRTLAEGLPIALLHVQVDTPAEDGAEQDETRTQVALARVARLLHASLYRANDLVARIGDRRLAVLLPETDERGATAIARRLRREVAQSYAPDQRAAELSIGISSYEGLRLRRGQQFEAADLDRQAAAALDLAAAGGPGGRLQALDLT